MAKALTGHLVTERSRPSDDFRVEWLFAAAAFGLFAVLAYTQNVNWDEFYFLSRVHAFLDGRLDRPLQTFFVHGFTWLDKVPGHEMTQIFAARLVMIGFLAVTCFSIHRIAREFTNRRSAGIAVLAFLTSAYVLPHGTSFRADPIATAFLTSSIAIILTTRMAGFQIILVAALSALALLVTIKSVLYLPAFFAALLWRIEDRGVALRVVGTGLLSAGLSLLLYQWHSSTMAIAEGMDTATNAKSALSTTILKSGLFPRSLELLNWILFSLAQVALAIWGLTAKRGRKCIIVLLLFATPFLSVVFYRNAYPYFFPFATPLLMIAVAVGVQRITRPKVLYRLLAVMVISAGAQLCLYLPKGTQTQRATIAEVHRLFDQPVPYIDHSNMMASFPKAGFFMSSWGITRYRSAMQPVFADIIERVRPPLLIASKGALVRTMESPVSIAGTLVLLPEDQEVLRRSYVHYAGAIWLAGQETTLTDDVVALTVPFPGRYRVETEHPVKVNNRVVSNGIVLDVDAAPLELTGKPGTAVRLIWDTGIAPIAPHSLGRDIYVGFPMVSL
ncbi:hypothetical protein [uncultured Ruegeria sp.]|uniref:hypothetical protein n=1 Tax=uncultured Ruegeria sp. TaxID=259304 RepID=UPI002603C901|nr:hypothetical protein [uncultured Ruegeria sp.]